MRTFGTLILLLSAVKPAAAVPETRDALEALSGIVGGIGEKRVFKGLTPWKEPCEVHLLPGTRMSGELSIRTTVNGNKRGVPEVSLAAADHIEKLVDDRDHGLIEIETVRKSGARSDIDRHVRLHVQRTSSGELAFVVREERWGWFPLPHVEQARCLAR